MQRGHSRGSSIDEANIENVPSPPPLPSCVFVRGPNWLNKRAHISNLRSTTEKRRDPLLRCYYVVVVVEKKSANENAFSPRLIAVISGQRKGEGGTRAELQLTETRLTSLVPSLPQSRAINKRKNVETGVASPLRRNSVRGEGLEVEGEGWKN